MSENQNWQEQLQQRAGELIAQRLGNFAEELQTVQTALNGIRERVQTNSAPVTAEETAGLHECLDQVRYTAIQEVESSFQSRLNEAIHQAREETASQLRAEYEGKLQDLQTELENTRQASSSGMEGAGMAAAGVGGYAVSEADSEAQSTSYHTLRMALEEIDAQRQQADVLATLVRHAANYAPRAVFFVIKSGSAIGWRATGFTNGLSDETVRMLNIPLAANDALREATSASHTVALNNATMGVLGHYDAAVAHAVAVPLVIRGKAAAVLYADAGTDGGTINLDALESLMQVTSMAIELLPVRRSQPVVAQPVPPPAPQPAPPPPAPTPESATSFAFQTPEETPVVTASVITPLPTGGEAKEAAPAASVASSSPTGQSDDEVRAHNDARRFARLLVSEIKLYNEQKVVEGRRSHDLYERLKEDIDRSRQMYEKRVSASVAAKFDYFYDELLHTLGEGDPVKLGSGCPGPTVPVS